MDDSMLNTCYVVEISEEDVLEAMKALPGYIDITPADFREVYRFAHTAAKKRIMEAVRVIDVMSTPIHVAQADMDLVQAASLLAEKNVSGAPVVDGRGRIEGVVSEKDFLSRMGAGPGGSFMLIVANCLRNRGCVAAPIRKLTVGEIMTSPAVIGRAYMSAAEAAVLLRDNKINRLPIIDDQGCPVGIVTRWDLVHSYGRLG